MKDERPASPGHTIGPYVVAYVDIMGQKDRLAGSQTLPINPTDVLRAKKGIEECLKQILILRTELQRFFSTQSASLAVPDSHPLHLLVTGKRAPMVKLHMFSDTLILFAKLYDDSPEAATTLVPEQGLARILYGLGRLVPFALAQEIPVRGGVEIGFATEVLSGEVFGPAAVAAYRLETEPGNADYPRIVVGDTLAQFIGCPKEPPLVPGQEFLASSAKRQAFLLTKTDIDDKVIIDWLSDHWLNRLVEPGQQDSEQLVYRAYKFALKQSKSGLPDKIDGKYKRLLEYFTRNGQPRTPGV
jgi:hypothetical protein